MIWVVESVATPLSVDHIPEKYTSSFLDQAFASHLLGLQTKTCWLPFLLETFLGGVLVLQAPII